MFCTALSVDIDAITVVFIYSSSIDCFFVTEKSFGDTVISLNSVEDLFGTYNTVEKSVSVATIATEHLVIASNSVKSAISSISSVGTLFSDYCSIESHQYTSSFVRDLASASKAVINRQSKRGAICLISHWMSLRNRRRFYSRRRFLNRTRCKQQLIHQQHEETRQGEI